jgi:hypothetical protein
VHASWQLLLRLVSKLIFCHPLCPTSQVVVEISNATVFILFSDDPESLAYAHPVLFDKLMRAWEKRLVVLPGWLRALGTPKSSGQESHEEDEDGRSARRRCCCE